MGDGGSHRKALKYEGCQLFHSLLGTLSSSLLLLGLGFPICTTRRLESTSLNASITTCHI